MALVVAALVWAGTGLHAFGAGLQPLRQPPGPRVGSPAARHELSGRTTFDYRGFDTLGEEFILFVSVVGVMVLLRAIR